MVNCGDDAGDDGVGASKAWRKMEYDTSSGDSCWVRQYLEWYHPVGADLADEGGRPIQIKAPGAYVT